jgi:hypothetical protein
MSGSVAVSINTLPILYTVTGGGSYCTGGTGVTVGLSSSTPGVNYQLYRGASTVGSPVAGTGSAISFGLQTTAGTYTVVATNASTSCMATMTGSVSVGINSLPAAFTVTGGGSYCTGGTAPNVYLSGSTGLTTYQLYLGGSPVGSPVSGSGGGVSFGAQAAAGTYTVVATSTLSGCTNNMTSSATVTIVALPTVYAMTGGGSYCTGGTGVAVGLAASASGVNYQLYRGATAIGSAVAGTGSALSFGLQTTAGTYTVTGRSTALGCTSSMSGSAVVSVNSLPPLFTVTGGGSYCTGGTGVAVGLSSSVTSTNYQLYRGGSPVGSPVAGTGTTLTFGLQTTAGTYTVVATNTVTSCVANMTGSVTVAVNALPTVYTMTGGGSYCTGGSGVAVGLGGSQTGISYQLYLGASPVGSAVAGTGAAISFGFKTAAGTYTVIATASTSCTSNMTGSAVVSINAMPTTYTVTGGGSYCSGGTGVAVGLSGSQTGVNYQLYRSTTAVGSPVAGTGSAISFGLQTTAATYTVKATNATTGCFEYMTGSVSITTTSLPTVVTMTGGGAYCSGGTGVAVGLAASIGGVNYQLYLSGSPVGSPVAGVGGALNFGLQTAAGVYTAVATNPVTGCSSTMSGSATVSILSVPSVSGVIYTLLPTGSITLTGSPTGGTFTSSNLAVVTVGASSGVVSGVALGIANITYTLGTGCKATRTVSVTPTGFRQSPAENMTSVLEGSSISIIPNPNPGTFSITGQLAASVTADEELTLDVTNMLGQVVYHSSLFVKDREINEHIQVPDQLPNGMYLLSLRNGKENKVFHIVIER